MAISGIAGTGSDKEEEDKTVADDEMKNGMFVFVFGWGRERGVAGGGGFMFDIINHCQQTRNYWFAFYKLYGFDLKIKKHH